MTVQTDSKLVADLTAELEQWVGDDATMPLRNALRAIIREHQETDEPARSTTTAETPTANPREST